MQGNEAVGAVSNVLLKTLSPDRAQVCGLDGVDGIGRRPHLPVLPDE